MIRWDNAGEHIIVERPEQLALHVLPSVYRQSRFASFSRQLNVSRRSVSGAVALSIAMDGGYSLDLSCHVNSLLVDMPPCFFLHSQMADPQICRSTVSCARSTYGT